MIEGALHAWVKAHPSDHRVGVAVSGGRDSMVLLDATCRVQTPACVVHVDHGVRPDSADDHRWVEAEARGRGLPVYAERLAGVPPKEAELRRARHQVFERAAGAHRLDRIWLAHHRADQAETVLMRAIRGGVLGGMPSLRGVIGRPLLACPAQALAAYAERKGIRWREDPSNRDPRWLRNRVRKELLPLLERAYRPGVEARLAEMADRSGWIEMSHRPWGASEEDPDDAWSARFDARKVPNPRVRPSKPGDMMLGGKSDSELLHSTAPMPALVVADAETVLWLPGVGRLRGAGPDSGTRFVWEFRWKWA